MNIKILNINYVVGFITLLSLMVGFLTIQTFAGKGFFELNPKNIQILLIVNLFLLVTFLFFVFYKFYQLYIEGRNKKPLEPRQKKSF